MTDSKTAVILIIPTWLEINAEMSDGASLNPMEKFIHANEPTGQEDSKWREQLRDMLEWVRSA